MYQQPFFPVPFPLGHMSLCRLKSPISLRYTLCCGPVAFHLVFFKGTRVTRYIDSVTLTPYVAILLDSVQITHFSHIGPAARWIWEICAMRNDINTCDASFFLVQGCVKIDFLVVMQGTDVWHRIMSFKTRTIDRASHSNVLLERQGPEPDALCGRRPVWFWH